MTRPSVLITGGARRVGAAIVRRFARAGWHVIIHCRNSRDEADRLAAALPAASIVQCDLADEVAAAAMVEQLARELPDWRALINNASLFEYDNGLALDPAINRRAMQVNAVTPVLMAQAYFRHARSNSGRRVIHLTDQKLANPNPDFFSYSMSKNALSATIPMLAKAANRTEDKVFGLAPGAILASHDQTEDEAERSHLLNLLARRTGVGEIADGALFLATATLTSGQTLFVDSGQHLLEQRRDVIYLARNANR